MSNTSRTTVPRRLGRGRVLLVALLVAAALAMMLARPAHAGTYTVTQCSSVTAFTEARWERSTDHYGARSLCGTDAGLQAFHAAESTGLWHFGAWVWRAPP